MTRDKWAARILEAAQQEWRHVPWSVEFDECTHRLELTACYSQHNPHWSDVMVLSIAEWAMVGSAAEMRADAIIAELFKTCKRPPQQTQISYMNGRIAKDKWEARLEAWREHFGILAEVAEVADGLGRRR